MGLEKLLKQNENNMRKTIDNLPWYAELFFGNEINETKGIIKKSSQLRKQYKNYQTNPEFYYQQGELIAQSRDITIAAANKIYDLYELFKPIPFIGKYFETALLKPFKGTLKKAPSRQGLISLIDNGYKLALSTGSGIAETNTNNNFEYYYQKANRSIQEKNYNTGFYKVFTETVKKIYIFFTGENEG